jgi:hypothetical protein
LRQHSAIRAERIHHDNFIAPAQAVETAQYSAFVEQITIAETIGVPAAGILGGQCFLKGAISCL